jgi:hypothetical protein
MYNSDYLFLRHLNLKIFTTFKQFINILFV